MEVHIYRVKTQSQTGNIGVKDLTKKRPKSQDIQLVIFKIYTFCWKIQQRLSGPG